jgi:IclR family transcriptional regulator, acetate operon repressor
VSDYAGGRLDQTPAKEVHSIARALTVLESLTKSDHDLGVSEIAKLTGLPVGTSHRILATLAYHGYVRQNDETRRYGPGMRLLGIAASAHERLGRTARSFLTQLMQASQETANLAILEGNSTLYIEQVPPPRMLRIFTEPGNRAFLHAAGTGKVLLAYQDQNVIDSIVERTGLPRLTPNTITEPAALLEVLERVRTQGYAIDLEEQEEGVCCLAAPVFTPDGALLAAMSVSGPAGRLGRGRLHDLVPHIKRVASALSRTINSIENRSPRAPVLGRDQIQGRSRLK